MYNVLVFPCGSNIAHEVFYSLCNSKHIELFGANIDIPNHGPYLFKNYRPLKFRVNEGEWIDELNSYLEENKIDLILPCSEETIVVLKRNEEKIKSIIATSPLETCEVAYDKVQLYEKFLHVVPVPKLFDPFIPSELPYRYFIKPRIGSGGRGAGLIEGVPPIVKDDFIYMEELPGDEFTVDCFSSLSGIQFINARIRERIFGGVAIGSINIGNNRYFQDTAEKIAKELKFRGPWFFQMKMDKKYSPKLTDIGCRIAAGIQSRALGVNLPLLTVYEFLGAPYRIGNKADCKVDKALISRGVYNIKPYRTVYVDLDDTLIVKEKINTNLVRFLYQCVNAGKKLILLTKTLGDPWGMLNDMKLGGLFDEVIHTHVSDNKYKHIHDTDSIFIDDSFDERALVEEKVGIPTFDNSMVEFLIDWRT